jgi:hypothetical protein
MPWAKGQSGNPSGRPTTNKEIQALAKEATPEAFARLKSIMRQQKDIKAALTAALAIIERGHGKVRQAVEVTGAEEGPIQVETLSDAEAARRIAFALAKGLESPKEEEVPSTSVN